VRHLSALACSILAANLAWAGPPPATPDALMADVDGLRAAKVAWREIPWKTCLLDGLKESREKKKPVLLWVFIDRPADDARC
jgi:hypothetical protein